MHWPVSFGTGVDTHNQEKDWEKIGTVLHVVWVMDCGGDGVDKGGGGIVQGEKGERRGEGRGGRSVCVVWLESRRCRFERKRPRVVHGVDLEGTVGAGSDLNQGHSWTCTGRCI